MVPRRLFGYFWGGPKVTQPLEAWTRVLAKNHPTSEWDIHSGHYDTDKTLHSAPSPRVQNYRNNKLFPLSSYVNSSNRVSLAPKETVSKYRFFVVPFVQTVNQLLNGGGELQSRLQTGKPARMRASMERCRAVNQADLAAPTSSNDLFAARRHNWC